MKSSFRNFGAVILGLIVAALIFNGGTSLNPIAKPAYAQLTVTQITDTLNGLEGLSTDAQGLLDNISPSVFEELGNLSSTDLSDLSALNLNSITSFPGLSSNAISEIVNLPETGFDDLLNLDASLLGNLGDVTDDFLGQIDTFIDLGDSLGLDSLDILDEFDNILPGDLNTILNAGDLFENFDIANLNNIAGNLGIDFGSFTENIADSLNVDIGNLVNFDFAELSSLGIGDLDDLIGNLGLPQNVLNDLSTALGTNITDLLNVNLADLDLLGIGGLDDLSDLVGLDPSDLLNDLTNNLGINPEDMLGDLTGALDLDLDNILNFDFDELTNLGLDNITDLANVLNLDVNNLLGDLSSALNIPIGDLANLNLDNLTEVLNIDNIADLSNIIGLDSTGLLTDLSGALGLEIGDFTDISLDALSNIGLDNALDLANAINIDPADLASSLGVSLDALGGLSIPDIGAAINAGGLGDIVNAVGGDFATTVENLTENLGITSPIAVGLIGILLGNNIIPDSSIGCSGGYSNGYRDCDCNGWFPPPVGSCTQTPRGCDCYYSTTTCNLVSELHSDVLRPYFDIELMEYERWLVQDVFGGYILPSMMAMTEELTAVAMHQVAIIGSFFDAKMQLETQRLLQDFQAQAHKDYMPSEGVCALASNVRGLAMTERYVDTTQSILSTRAANRHLGIQNDNAAGDYKNDLGEQFTSHVDNTEYRSGRLKQFQDQFCNPRENNEKLEFLCGNAGAGAPDAGRLNNDMDFYDNFASQQTLYIDFFSTETEKTEEEINAFQDYLALNKNLYGHKVPYRPSPADFDTSAMPGFAAFQEYMNHRPQDYLNLRAMLAKRSVAENSFLTQTALKAKGDAASAGNMSVILHELGMSSDAIHDMMKGAPSYYAQMELLTKKIYQDPHFYIDLYDKPANVKRKHVALRAIGVMQEWDTLEVNLRTEMLAAVLLELGLIEAQYAIQNR